MRTQVPDDRAERVAALHRYGILDSAPEVVYDEITMLATMDFDLSRGERVTLGPGGFFGEIGALNGWPQSVTARASTPLTVLQIRVPALRKLKRKSKALKRSIDDIYRERVLHRHLQTSPLLRGCGEQVVAELASRVELVSCEPDEASVVSR